MKVIIASDHGGINIRKEIMSLMDELEIQYIDFQRPRPALVSELGEEHQGCPKLILGDPTCPVPSNVTVNEAKGRRFISDDIEICRYLAKTHGVGEPH